MFDMTLPISGAAPSNPNNLTPEELEAIRQMESSFGFGSGLSGINESLQHFRLKHASVLYPTDLENILNIYALSNKIDISKIYQLTKVKANVDFKKHHVSIPVSIYNECDIEEVVDVSMLQDSTVLLSENKSTATFSIADIPADVVSFVVVGYTLSAQRKITFDNAVCYYRQDANNFVALKMRIAKGTFTFSDELAVVGIEKIKTRTAVYSRPPIYPGLPNHINDDYDHLYGRNDRIPSSSRPHLPGLTPARPGLSKPHKPSSSSNRMGNVQTKSKAKKPAVTVPPKNAATFNTDPFDSMKK